MTEPTPPTGQPGYTPPPTGMPAPAGPPSAPQFTMPDFKSLPPFELGALVVGVVVFLASFILPWYGYSYSGSANIGGGGASINAWHSYDVLAQLLFLVALAVVAGVVFFGSTLPALPIGYRWIAAAAAVVGALIFILRLFTLSHASASGFGYKASYGVRWGGWIDLILVLAFAALTVMSALGSNEENPMNMVNKSPSAPPAA